ncbi:transcriptional repressor LexA [Corynebacterium ulceribovis]|uniref:transcriptional repressor LexA n=1 Tax=Corynebacterium ulceribovis TaxID=487732 RepID=UPI00035F533B|nr:transcriptional repressor LexA [Corynebacterium ulceribovis]
MAAKSKNDDLLNGITNRQRQIVDVISNSMSLRGYAPSYREIGNAVGLKSTSSVSYQVDELCKKGIIKRDPNRPRAMVICVDLPGSKRTFAEPDVVDEERHTPPSYVPVVGQIAAGSPILAEEHVEDHFALPIEVVGDGENSFVLQVKGDSMVDAGILEDDWVVVKETKVAQNGDFVAAMLTDDIEPAATVKEFISNDTGIWLMPHNRAYSPIPGEHATIMGRVVAVFRKL